MHRSCYQKERRAYKARVQRAIEKSRLPGNEGCVCSIIMDIMDQNKLRLPSLGTKQQFANPMNQLLLGLMEHTQNEITFYRSFHNVKKGANMTIYALLDYLEKWNQRYQRYPEELIIQIDGGSENANRYLLALCEWLTFWKTYESGTVSHHSM